MWFIRAKAGRYVWSVSHSCGYRYYEKKEEKDEQKKKKREEEGEEKAKENEKSNKIKSVYPPDFKVANTANIPRHTHTRSHYIQYTLIQHSHILLFIVAEKEEKKE